MSSFLIDPFNRIIDYLRVSITDLCNFRCIYCRPPQGVKLVSHDDILRYEEILAIVKAAQDTGIRKIRVTGGEPLVRRGVLDFLGKLSALGGIEDIGLTTNGLLLVEMAKALKSVGLNRINVSLDSMRREVFKAITGFDALDQVLLGIEKALEEGLNPVKINVVLLQGVNEPDIPALARLSVAKPIDVRFIERMPFSNSLLEHAPAPLSAFQALDSIEKEFGKLESIERSRLDGPAKLFRIPGAVGRIGIIDAVTGHFCGTCNRMRLTARGTLKPCLLSPGEIDIKTPLRAGASQEELAAIIRQAVLSKPVGQGSDGSGLDRAMNMIGG